MLVLYRQLPHLPTPSQEKQKDRELRLRGDVGRADSLASLSGPGAPKLGTAVWLARGDVSSLETRGAVRCSSHPHFDPRGNRCSRVQDLRPGLPVSRHLTWEPDQAGDRRGARWESS